MATFNDYLTDIDDEIKRERIKKILDYIKKEFPQLKEEIKWNQPMFTDHKTFIIGFSISKKHIAVAPEAKAINYFDSGIEKAGYNKTKEIFRIKWSDEINFELLKKIVEYNIKDKKNAEKFWR